MKIIIVFLLVFSLTLGCIGCDVGKEANNLKEPEQIKIKAEQQTPDVTLTIPASFIGFFGDESAPEELQDSLLTEAKERGFKSATLNEDGSVTYIMTEAQHKEMLNEVVQGIEESLSSMVASEESPNIVSIEKNSDYTDFKVSVSGDEIGLDTSFSVFGFFMFSGLYHVFNGTEAENVHVSFVDSVTGSVIADFNSDDTGDLQIPLLNNN